jgi:hypothetical protein
VLDGETQKMIELSRPPLSRRVFRLRNAASFLLALGILYLYTDSSWSSIGAREHRRFRLLALHLRSQRKPTQRRKVSTSGAPIRIHRFFIGRS